MDNVFAAFCDDFKEYYSEPDFSATATKLDISDIVSPDSPIKHHGCAVSEIDFPSPIQKVHDAINSLASTPAPKLRVVWLPLNYQSWTVAISKEDHESLLNRLQLRLAYRYSFASYGGFVTLPSSDPDTMTMCASNRMYRFAMTWTHHLPTQQTVVLCWGKSSLLSRLRGFLDQFRPWMFHPLFPALLEVRLSDQCASKLIYETVSTVGGVEMRTKHQNQIFEGTKVAQGTYAQLSAVMSGCASSLTLLNREIKLQQSILAAVDAYQKKTLESGNSATSAGGIDECVLLLQHRLQRLRDFIETNARRAEIQLTALFHLITSKETRISIAIAEESRTLASASKEDSTAMKTLAMVTVMFLPGAWVAALFAVPLFEWNAEADKKVLSGRFWVYWAVTVPLTMIIAVPWLVWTRQKTASNRKQLEQARENFRKEIGGLGEDSWEQGMPKTVYAAPSQNSKHFP